MLHVYLFILLLHGSSDGLELYRKWKADAEHAKYTVNEEISFSPWPGGPPPLVEHYRLTVVRGEDAARYVIERVPPFVRGNLHLRQEELYSETVAHGDQAIDFEGEGANPTAGRGTRLVGWPKDNDTQRKVLNEPLVVLFGHAGLRGLDGWLTVFTNVVESNAGGLTVLTSETKWGGHRLVIDPSKGGMPLELEVVVRPTNLSTANMDWAAVHRRANNSWTAPGELKRKSFTINVESSARFGSTWFPTSVVSTDRTETDAAVAVLTRKLRVTGYSTAVVPADFKFAAKIEEGTPIPAIGEPGVVYEYRDGKMAKRMDADVSDRIAGLSLVNLQDRFVKIAIPIAGLGALAGGIWWWRRRQSIRG